MAAVKSPKISETVATHIQNLILEGALRPGEKLVSERELAEKLEVSRPSVRDAIEKLTCQGLLKPARNGTYVAQFLAPMMAPLANLYRDNPSAPADYFELRQWVEAEAAHAAALRATRIEKAAIKICLNEMRKAHKMQDVSQEAQADVNLHMLVYEASHNFVVLHVMRALSELLRSNIFFNREHLYLRPGVRDNLLAQHIDIGNAVLTGDAARAETAARDHIRFVFGKVEELHRDNKRLKTSLLRVGRRDFISS